MSRYEIVNDDQVAPFDGGRMCTDTRAWRDATELELQQQQRIEELENELSNIPKQTEWQPISTAPKDGTEFIACYARQGNVMQFVRYSRVYELFQSKGEWIPGFENNATHWMPKPTPPFEAE